MSSRVDELPIVGYPTVILPAKSLLKKSTFIKNDENYVDQLTDRLEPSDVVQGNVRSGAPILIYFGPQQSSLRVGIVTYLKNEDVKVVFFSIEEHLWQWLDLNPSLTVVSLVLQPTVNIQGIVSRSHACIRVRSILIRCLTPELTTLQRLSRTYPKIDGVFNDDRRLLIKLVFDLTLFSEEIGDQQREDEYNEMEVQRNYDRALKLCALVQKF